MWVQDSAKHFSVTLNHTAVKYSSSRFSARSGLLIR